jgi:transposase-like protein
MPTEVNALKYRDPRNSSPDTLLMVRRPSRMLSRSSQAIPGLKEEGILRRRCRHRPVQYWNNILEQDHRAIQRRVKAKQNFREFQEAQRTLEGYEAMHMIREGQARWVSGNDIRKQNQFIDKLLDLPA